MVPMTERDDAGKARIRREALAACEDGSFAGPAADRLCAWEAVVAEIEREHAAVSEKLEAMKASGDVRRTAAQQLIAQKMAHAQTLARFGVDV